MQEIERKWLVKILPDNFDLWPSTELIAGYFEDENGNNTRIRQEGNRYFKVSKSGNGLVRDIGPGDTEITKEEFDNLWPKTKGRRLRKRRYFIIFGKFTIELDVYHDFPGFYTAEVEFNTTDEANAFVIPDWFGCEMTGEKKFSSNNIASHGLPESTGSKVFRW